MLLGCSKEPEAVVIDVTGASSAAASSAPTQYDGATTDGTSVSNGTPKVQVRDTAAYAFNGAKGPVLYGAVAYENTGTAPLTITEASFTFSFNNSTEEVNFTPIFAKNTIVPPGETAYAALWYAKPDVEPGTTVSLSASLKCEASDQSSIPIAVSNIHLAHNYPGFTTMTGAITPESDCPCNLVYAAFYGADEKFIGVWYFTENAQLIANEPKVFTSHMKEFPLADLAEQTAEIRAYAIGMS